MRYVNSSMKQIFTLAFIFDIFSPFLCMNRFLYSIERWFKNKEHKYKLSYYIILNP